MIYRFNTITIKILAGVLLVNIDKLILVLIGKGKGTRTVNTIWVRERKLEDSHWLILRLTIIKTVWYGQMDRHKDQRNIIENPKIYPHGYHQLIFDTESQLLTAGKRSYK